MSKRIFKNVYGKPINVHLKALAVNGIFKTDNIDQEIKNLISNGYLKEVDQTKASFESGTLK